MKKSLFILVASIACSGAVFATDWTYDYQKGGYGTDANKIIYSSTAGTADTPGLWKDSDGNYNYGTLPGASDSVTIGDTGATSAYYINVDTDVTWGSLSLGGKDSNSVRITSVNNINILGDLIRLEGTSQAFFYGAATISIGGNLEVKGGANIAFENTKSLVIDGNVSSTHSGNVYLKLSKGGNRTFEQGYLDPDGIIKGVVNNANVYLKRNTYDSFLQIGGVSGSGIIGGEAQVGKNSKTYIILKNAQDYTTSGATTETSWPGYWNETCGKLVLVMDGTASQSFTASKMMFFGGLKAMNGTIRINFNQDASQYSYYTNDAKADTITAVTKNDGTGGRTAFSHGTLEMLGGTFSSTDGDNSYGSFRFTDIVYTGGTIKLRLDGADRMDSIDLTGYYLESLATGGFTAVEGGTLTVAEGAGPVKFDFGDNLAWLVDSEGDGARIIAWDSSKVPQLTGDDFSGNIYTGEDGLEYLADFTVAEDGLYVKYVAVPEPSAFAMLAGLLAFGFAAYRRRR